MFSFQKYQYSVNASRSGFPVFDFTDVYQTSLSEDQILKIVNGLAEACLKHIEQQVRRKK
jgi:hypothetical protein